MASPDDPSATNLVEAFAAYARNCYKDAVIPANVAVETAFARVLNSYLSLFAGKKRVEDFLENNATYSSQLNVMLPVLAKLNDCPVMPENVRGSLNKLRRFRNDLAHDGHIEQHLSKDVMAELLAAATLGTAYIRFFEQSVHNQTRV